MVDKGARAAGARAVHALFDALVEVDDLRVLAAQLDGHVGGGDEGFHRRLGRDDLLHEVTSSHWDRSRPPDPVMAMVMVSSG